MTILILTASPFIISVFSYSTPHRNGFLHDSGQ